MKVLDYKAQIPKMINYSEDQQVTTKMHQPYHHFLHLLFTLMINKWAQSGFSSNMTLVSPFTGSRNAFGCSDTAKNNI